MAFITGSEITTALKEPVRLHCTTMKSTYFLAWIGCLQRYRLHGLLDTFQMKVQFSGGMVTQTDHAPPVFLAFLDPGTEFGGSLFSAFLHHLAYHALETVLLGPLLLDDVPDSIAPTLSTLSTLVFVDDVTDGVT